MTAYYTADGNTLRYIEGEQDLTDMDKSGSSRVMASVQIGEKARVTNSAGDPLKIDITANQVEQINFNSAATGGNLKLTVQKTDGTFATTANMAWNATDATFLANINTQLDASTGVAGGIVASAIPATDTDLGIRLTYSGTGYADNLWTPAVVNTFPTGPTSATYTSVTSSRANFITRSVGTRRFFGGAKGAKNLWQVLKVLGNQGFTFTEGRLRELHQRTAEFVANASGRLDAAFVLGGNFRSMLHATTNTHTDLIFKMCSATTERGFSGTCQVLRGAKVLFKRADNSTGTIPTGNILKILGPGECEWCMGNIAELHWLDGDFTIRNAPEALTIAKLYITYDNKKKLLEQLKSANATITLPSVVGVNLFVYGDETDDLS